MADTPTVQKWSDNIPDMSAAISFLQTFFLEELINHQRVVYSVQLFHITECNERFSLERSVLQVVWWPWSRFNIQSLSSVLSSCVCWIWSSSYLNELKIIGGQVELDRREEEEGERRVCRWCWKRGGFVALSAHKTWQETQNERGNTPILYSSKMKKIKWSKNIFHEEWESGIKISEGLSLHSKGRKWSSYKTASSAVGKETFKYTFSVWNMLHRGYIYWLLFPHANIFYNNYSVVKARKRWLGIGD